MLRPLAQTGHDPVSSMGDDAAIAPLAGRARPFSTYLRQRFAQVTNPAIDHLRERLVMSVATLLGPRIDVLGVDGPPPRLTVLPGFLLYPSGSIHSLPCDSTRRSQVRRGSGEPSTGSSCSQSLQSRRERSSSACPTATQAASAPRCPRYSRSRPCIRDWSRRACARAARCSWSRTSRATRTRSRACSATAPTRSVRGSRSRRSHSSPTNDRIGGDRPAPDEAQRRLFAAFEEGVLKVMSKMGIADVASYRGARLFEAVGLDRTLCREYLAGTPSSLGGARLERFEREALERLEPLTRRGRSSTTPATSSSARAASRTRRIRTSSPRCRTRSPRRTPFGQRCGRPLGSVRALCGARQRKAAARAPRPARARPGRPADPARGGRAGLGDRAPLLGRRDVTRSSLGGSPRDDRDRAQPPRRTRELRRGRGETRTAFATSATRRSSRLRRADSASLPSTRSSPRSCRSRSRKARSPAREGRSRRTR